MNKIMIAPIASIASWRVVISVGRKKEREEKRKDEQNTTEEDEKTYMYIFNEKRSGMRKKKEEREETEIEGEKLIISSMIILPGQFGITIFECYN